MYTFKASDYNVSYDQITRFRSVNKTLITHTRGWKKSKEIITVDESTLPIMFFGLFYDIGQIRALQNKPDNNPDYI